MHIIHCDNFAAFDQLLAQYEQRKATEEASLKSLILLFVASSDPTRDTPSESWCSDCRASKPVLDKIINEFEFNERIELALVQVGQRDDWAKEDNPFRLHKLKIGAVPTLISLKNVSTFQVRSILSLAHKLTNNHDRTCAWSRPNALTMLKFPIYSLTACRFDFISSHKVICNNFKLALSDIWLPPTNKLPSRGIRILTLHSNKPPRALMGAPS